MIFRAVWDPVLLRRIFQDTMPFFSSHCVAGALLIVRRELERCKATNLGEEAAALPQGLMKSMSALAEPEEKLQGPVTVALKVMVIFVPGA